MSSGRAYVRRVLVLAICGLLSIPLANAGATAGTVPKVPLARATEAQIVAGGDSDWLVSDGSAVWVQGFADLKRLDPETNAVTASVEVKDEICQGLGFGDGALWSCGGGGIVRVDPATAAITAVVPLDKGKDQGHLPVAAGHVWVITEADSGTLVGVSTTTNAVDVTVPLNARCTETASGFDAVWIACRSGELLRVDPVAAAVTARITDVPLAVNVVVNEQSVFVGYERGVARVDPDTNEITGRAKAPSGLRIGLAADDETVWVRSEKPYPFLRKIDADSMKVVARITSKLDSGGDILVAFDSVWTSTFDDAFVFRLDPVRIRA